MTLKRTHIAIIVLLSASILSFIVGMTVEATRHQYYIYECRQNLKETKQQLSIYKSELSHIRSESRNGLSDDISTMNWTEALK